MAARTTPLQNNPLPGSILPGRLLSLDALRGFDMIWILGIDEFARAWFGIDGSPFVRGFFYQLDHSPWVGVRFYDLIFPLFIFIAGVALVFSLSKIIAEKGRGAAVRRLVLRAGLLYLLGLLYYGGLSKTLGDIRLLGVLQRIALCYLFAGLMFIFLRQHGPQARPGLANSRWLVAVLAGLLIGYCVIMTFVPVPGVGAGNFEEGKNLANYVDKMYLPLMKWDGDHDPEGLLSTLPAVGTCLMGVLAGILLREQPLPPQKKAYWLAGAGIIAIGLGLVWGIPFPIIKKIWSSSYVLVAGGFSLIMLAGFYQILDIWCWRRPFMPFVWIGTNAITLYLLLNFVDFRGLASLLVGGPVKQAVGRPGEMLVIAVSVAMLWLLAYFLYRRKIFIKL